MAKMKSLLLKAAAAVQEVLDADGNLDQILELVDHADNIHVSERETR